MEDFCPRGRFFPDPIDIDFSLRLTPILVDGACTVVAGGARVDLLLSFDLFGDAAGPGAGDLGFNLAPLRR